MNIKEHRFLLIKMGYGFYMARNIYMTSSGEINFQARQN